MATPSTMAKRKYNSKAYDQINMVVPKGRKEELQKIANQMGMSLNNMLNISVNEFVEKQKNDCAEMVKK